MWTVFPITQKAKCQIYQGDLKSLSIPRKSDVKSNVPTLNIKISDCCFNTFFIKWRLKWSNGRCGIDWFWVYRNCNYLTKQKNMDQNIKEHLDKIVVNIMRWTHVTLPSTIQPFVPFFLISSGDGIWLYKYEANFISNIWVRALCASTICDYPWIYVCNCTNTYAC